VLLQFLTEAVVLSSFGGLAGVALATVGSFALARAIGVPYAFDAGISLIAFVLGGDRRGLWLLSGATGGAPRPDRGAAT